jgi:hypothetical protein
LGNNAFKEETVGDNLKQIPKASLEHGVFLV